ncbi:MAG: alpha/beta hydrolase [Planctomycetota bacterium]|nr:alpha/beta hydrolase [Planctomycetota bacterium]
MTIEGVHQGGIVDGYRPVRIVTDRGETHFRLYGGPEDWEMPNVDETIVDPSLSAASRFDAGVVWAPGAAGGWNSPARGLYDQVIGELSQRDIPSLRVLFRDSRNLLESSLDVLIGAAYLESLGIARIGLVGHSFGGAAVIQAAAQQCRVSTVVTLASQSSGAEAASDLGPDRSLLLLHGLGDEILPAWTSRQISNLSTARTRLITYPHANHSLDEVAPQARREVLNWLLSKLAPVGA